MALHGRDEPDGLVGLSEIPNQLHRVSAKKGYEFTILVVGRRGLGKRTLLDALFETSFTSSAGGADGQQHDLSGNSDTYNSITNSTSNNSLDNSLVDDDSAENSSNEVKIIPHYANLEEKGIRVQVTKLEAKYFAEGLDTTNHVQPILNYIVEQFEKYFVAESGLNRRNLKRTLVDCCIYCIAPWQRSLKPIDIKLMKTIQEHVNLVPVICKSDTLTDDERAQLKSNILHDIRKHGINMYEPVVTADDDEQFRAQVAYYRELMPFAVAASKEKVDINGKVARVRRYPWGVLSVNDTALSDFTALRHFIVDHINDLRERTREVHYENYRTRRLRIATNVAVPSGSASVAGSKSTLSGGSGRSGGESTTTDTVSDIEERQRRLREEELRLAALKTELEMKAMKLNEQR